MEAIRSRYSPYELGFEGLTLSKSCESSLYTQRLVRLQEFYTKPIVFLSSKAS